jgi:hypothetical protein
MDITRLLVANRGEIALRIIRACREMGIETVAVYSDADATARHVRAADFAVRIGPAPASESYLKIPAVIDAARAAGANAVHPGYWFLSERAAFAEACAAAGLMFVGPPAGAIERMGSKIGARALMEQAGVPVVPGRTPGDQTTRARRARRGEGSRLSGRPPAAAAGMRTARDRRSEGSDPRGAPRGAGGVRRRHALRRAADRTAAARRDPDLCRRRRPRRSSVRARVLRAAPAPEDHRGKPVAGADAGDP